MELSEHDKEFISLEDLSPIYVKHMLEHVRSGKRQITSQGSKFIQACQLYEAKQITYEQLLLVTEKLGFKNVLDAFHNVPGTSLQANFFIKDVRGKRLGITLSDDLFKMNNGTQGKNMLEEVEGRWNLVETAWNERNPNLEIKYDINNEDFFTFRPVTAENYLKSHNRIHLTPVRKPLNGYQKGKCFYCFGPISITTNHHETCDVDHFIPLSIQYSSSVDLDLNGVWNLVLACQECNRGDKNGKFARLPEIHFLHRLNKRNEYLIQSNHPLKETLMMRTGKTQYARNHFLEVMFNLAKSIKAAEWVPEYVKGEGF